MLLKLSGLSETVHYFLNKTKFCIGVRRPTVKTCKFMAHKCITHSTG